jgi:hypothetical protein
MNQLLMERYLTHSRVIKNVKSVEKVEEMLFVYGYWVDFFEYKGEKKERYKFLDGNDEVRKFYEGLFENFVLQKEYVRFLDLGAEKKVKNKEGAASSFTKENVSKFIGLRKLDDSFNKSSISTHEKEDFQGELEKVPIIKLIKRVKRQNDDSVKNLDIKKRFPGRKIVPVITSFGSIKKQEKRFAKKKKLI